jgi:hypothetical protein
MAYGSVECGNSNPQKAGVKLMIYTTDGYNGCRAITKEVDGEIMVKFLTNPNETPYGLGEKSKIAGTMVPLKVLRCFCSVDKK